MSAPTSPAEDQLDRNTVVARLHGLGHTLPDLPAPRHAYVQGTHAAGFLYLSGITPKRAGELVLHGICGSDVTTDQAANAAELCAVNSIAALDMVVGLATLQSVVRVTVYVASASDYTEQAIVADAASTILERVLGVRGRHARTAVGVASLPGGAPVEVELTAYCPERTHV